MKHVKMLGLLVMAAASLMAFTSSASALILTNSEGKDPGTIHATLKPGTTALLKAIIEDTCTVSTAHGNITINNNTHAAGALTEKENGLSFGSLTTPCTKDTTTLASGELTINDTKEVFAIGNEVTVKDTNINQSCVYGGGVSPGTKIGTLVTGTEAQLEVNTTKLKRIAGSGLFCAPEGTWTATYVITSPVGGLFIT